jgi:membrane fusion protein (multidrug efflux system)
MSPGSDRNFMRGALRVTALAALSLALGSCGRDGGSGADAHAKSAAAASPPVPVAVRRVEPQRVPIVLEAVGQAEGSREVEVRARVSGILERRLYNEGEWVRAGQLLFEIDRRPFEIAVEQAKAARSQERARQEQAQREAERLKPLVETRAISQREYDQAVSTLKESSAAIQMAQAKLAEAELNLSYTSLRAPIGGITGRAARSEGSLIAANTDLLTTITQVNPIWVRFSLAEADFERVRGSAHEAQVDIVQNDGTIAARAGRLNFTGSTVDPKLGTVQLRAEFPNGDLRWLPGRFLKVQILAGAQQAYLVPQSAVAQSEQTRSVWIAGPDGKANPRTVTTANWLGADWIVTAGLNPGDLVIVDNLMKLRPGAPVDPHPAGAAAQAASAPGAVPATGVAPASAAAASEPAKR